MKRFATTIFVILALIFIADYAIADRNDGKPKPSQKSSDGKHKNPRHVDGRGGRGREHYGGRRHRGGRRQWQHRHRRPGPSPFYWNQPFFGGYYGSPWYPALPQPYPYGPGYYPNPNGNFGFYFRF